MSAKTPVKLKMNMATTAIQVLKWMFTSSSSELTSSVSKAVPEAVDSSGLPSSERVSGCDLVALSAPSVDVGKCAIMLCLNPVDTASMKVGKRLMEDLIYRGFRINNTRMQKNVLLHSSCK